MRVLWVSCLLIGSITCSPVGKKSSANNADTSFIRPPLSSGYWFSGRGPSSDVGSSSSLSSQPNPSSSRATGLPAPQDAISSAGSGSYSSNTNMAAGNAFYGGYASERYNSPEVSNYAVAYAGYGYDGNTPGGGYGSSAGAYAGDSWSSGSANVYDGGAEDQEPVFSDVSDLEPVYSYSSRSSYQRGRAVFAQTRYTPGDSLPQAMPVPQVMPASRRISKTEQSDPAKAPAKRAF